MFLTIKYLFLVSEEQWGGDTGPAQPLLQVGGEVGCLLAFLRGFQ